MDLQVINGERPIDMKDDKVIFSEDVQKNSPKSFQNKPYGFNRFTINGIRILMGTFLILGVSIGIYFYFKVNKRIPFFEEIFVFSLVILSIILSLILLIWNMGIDAYMATPIKLYQDMIEIPGRYGITIKKIPLRNIGRIQRIEFLDYMGI